MRKIVAIALTLLVLIGLALYVSNSDSSSTISGELSNFAVEDTSSITKIFLADKNNQAITLDKTQNGWMVNGTFQAREDIMQVLLETIKKIKVRSPVSRSSFENIVKSIASNSVKVEIYQGGDKPSKVYYVGGPNQDHTGTYMLLEGSNVPFLMHIEGFRGYITPRYFTNINEWRTNAIFALPPQQIQSIQLDFPKEPTKSWKINKSESNSLGFEINYLQTGKLFSAIDTGYLARYIKRYEMVYFEGFEETKTQNYIDSIIDTTPEQIYTVTDTQGNSTEIKVYLKPVKKGSEDYDGNPIDCDLDRLYGYLNNKDFVVIQHVIFDPLEKRPEDFLKRTI